MKQLFKRVRDFLKASDVNFLESMNILTGEIEQVSIDEIQISYKVDMYKDLCYFSNETFYSLLERDMMFYKMKIIVNETATLWLPIIQKIATYTDEFNYTVELIVDESTVKFFESADDDKYKAFNDGLNDIYDDDYDADIQGLNESGRRID